MKNIQIAEVDITCEESVKLLGKELDCKLNFDSQITNMCIKATKQLKVLQRLDSVLNEKSRFLIFISFIQSNFNYCPLVWHFCSKTNIEILEKLQYTALKLSLAILHQAMPPCWRKSSSQLFI